MRRYIVLVNREFWEAFKFKVLNKTYIKRYEMHPTMGDYMYILEVKDTFTNISNFYIDIKEAKVSKYVYFIGSEIFDGEEK